MIQLNIDIKTFNKIYVKDGNLTDYSCRFEAYYGSAGSGKSYFIACKLLIKALREKRRILVCRKYGTTLRNSVMQLFKEILTEYKLIDYCNISDHNRIYELPNGSQLIFLSLDDESKLLSLQNIDTIWVEETTEVEKEIFDQLNLRMRGKAKDQQIIFSFNPISRYHWLYEFCVTNQPQSFKLIHSTYKDNRFLSKAYVDALEDMYRTNPRKAIVYCDGEWATDPDGLIFQNVNTKPFNIDELMNNRNFEIRIGMDTGFIDSTAVVVCLVNQSTREFYVIKEIYKDRLSLDQIYTELDKTGILDLRKPIYVDSADQRAISFLKSKFVNVKPAIKGKGSIEAGISFLQNYIINIHPTCINIVKEFETYSYYKDPKTGRYVEDKYEKVYGDHAIDACRYAVCDLYTKRQVTVSSKSKYGF